MTKHMMIDIETLGTSSQAPIVQIGAVTNSGEEFLFTVDIDDAVRNGVVDGSTVKWWLSQSKEAIDSVFNTDINGGLEKGLKCFYKFCKDSNCDFYWSHATFDFPVISDAYHKNGVKPPYAYYNCRDLRTIEHFYGNDIKWSVREGVHHNALDDAKYQMKHLIDMLDVADKRGD